LFEEIFSREELQKSPPVLVDIGASGKIHPKWRLIAPYSICIAFDADLRDMGYIEKENSGYKKLYVYPTIVAEAKSENINFYLTKSPHCSSILKPDQKSLGNWAFAPLFEVIDTCSQNAIDLPSVLSELGIKQVDWFKTDSQGTDLRLFKSLGGRMLRKSLIAEFEPGIIDAYIGEDKLCSLMGFFDGQPFWMSNIEIKGTQRFLPNLLKKHFSDLQQRFVDSCLRKSPCWAEVTYLNSFEDNTFSSREFLLGWVFATIETQHGFAFELAKRAFEKFGDPFFEKLQNMSLKQMEMTAGKLTVLAVKKVLRMLHMKK